MVSVDPERIKNWSGRTSKVTDLVVAPTYLHDGYEVVHCDDILTSTGRLEVLKLAPKGGDGPSFVARWDNHAEALDIDMRDASDPGQADFKSGRGGYRGHHTVRAADPDRRAFSLRIETPENVKGLIFDGEVSFSNTFDVMVHELAAQGGLFADAQVVHPADDDR
jgi:hypothetical protein